MRSVSRASYSWASNKCSRFSLSIGVGLIVCVLSFSTFVVTVSAQNSIDSVIKSGNRGEDTIRSRILTLLKQYGGLKEFALVCPSLKDDCALTHEIVDVFYIDYLTHPAAIVVAHSNTDPVRVTHALAPPFSFFEFSRNDGKGWELDIAHINAARLGSWMKAPNDIKVIPIGHNFWGVVIKDQYVSMWQGGQLDYTTIFTPVAGKFREVFHVVTGYKRFGRIDEVDEEVVGHISFVEDETSYYDIVLNTQRVSPGHDLLEPIVFRFDGIKYTSPEYQD